MLWEIQEEGLFIFGSSAGSISPGWMDRWTDERQNMNEMVAASRILQALWDQEHLYM